MSYTIIFSLESTDLLPPPLAKSGSFYASMRSIFIAIVFAVSSGINGRRRRISFLDLSISSYSLPGLVGQRCGSGASGRAFSCSGLRSRSVGGRSQELIRFRGGRKNNRQIQTRFSSFYHFTAFHSLYPCARIVAISVQLVKNIRRTTTTSTRRSD